MTKYKNKYRIESARAQWWDYQSKASYFITINTANGRNYFGKIINCKIILSEIGIIAKSEWLKTPLIRRDMNIILDEFQIMPNHFHAIIIIGKNKFNTAQSGLSVKTPGQNKFGPQRKNLGSVIGGFKRAVTTYAWKNNITFDWHTRYYESIIWNKDSLDRIRQYIKLNPKNYKP
jgi:REP element-mobilizing transposase RayT